MSLAATFVPVRFSGLSSRPGRLAFLTLAWLVVSEIVIGSMLVSFGSSLTLLFVVLLAVPAALAIRADQLVLLTLTLLFLSRLLVSYGAPATLNFAHFPLAALAMIKLLERPAARSNTRLNFWLLASLAFTVVGAAATSWQAFRPFLSWITLCEPFIFFGLVASLDPVEKTRLRMFAFALCAVQIPFAFMQFAQFGVGDGVQGTLVGQGAGHHIVGAVTAAGGLVLLWSVRKVPLLVVPVALAMIGIGVLADAKQVYGALFIAMAVGSLIQGRPAIVSLLLPGAVIVVLMLSLAPLIYEPLDYLLNEQIIDEFTGDKSDQASRTVNELGLSNALLGVGAGNGISRTALSTVPTYGNVPEILVGSQPSALAQRELLSYDTIKTSSAGSPFSSWLGMYTDLGLLGLVTYLALAACVWRTLRHAPTRFRDVGRCLLLFAALLGFVFTWLEEPAFMVFLAVILGSGIELPADRPVGDPAESSTGSGSGSSHDQFVRGVV